MKWLVYFVSLAQTICKTKLEMSALLLKKCFKTNSIIQINSIWVWAIFKAVIMFSFFSEKATSEWSVQGIRDYYCRGRLAARIQHTVGSGRWILWTDRKEKAWGYTHCQQWYHLMFWFFTVFTRGFALWETHLEFFNFFVFVLNLKGLRELYQNIEHCWARYLKNVINYKQYRLQWSSVVNIGTH